MMHHMMAMDGKTESEQVTDDGLVRWIAASRHEMMQRDRHTKEKNIAIEDSQMYLYKRHQSHQSR